MGNNQVLGNIGGAERLKVKELEILISGVAKMMRRQEVMGLTEKMILEGEERKADQLGKGLGDMNVKIDRIEVQSDDPDRFAFGLTETLYSIARNPSQARNAFGGM